MTQQLRTLALGRGQGFDSYHPYGGSQLSVTPVLGESNRYTFGIHIFMQAKHSYT